MPTASPADDSSVIKDDFGNPGNSLEAFLGYNLKRAFNAIHANLMLTLRAFDLRMVTYSALVVVVERAGLRQSQLADALGIERANTVAIVDELVNRGLISRERTPADRRAYALIPTSAGRDLCARAMAADRACEAQIKACLTQEGVRRLIADLGRIEEAAQIVLEARTKN
ncbi:MarR family winged helix-turn-helix transcriptional regulator [Roseinatronobacter alkalisoli]|uniref:MarR family transcriptional regulator n=1 Tax=Roseinatronobacter alkalisoli TaxID=3028235 RepID=A0ABT5TAM0_9RHOB|nr:MarR family transcriptional regulator [Roseinatronobacter sp. HJB301]MDD7972158.1 MarR family transcriptional regulator [Roseinatronobacter sp. HJB301]